MPSLNNEFVYEGIRFTYNEQFEGDRQNVECSVQKQYDQRRRQSLRKTCDCQSIKHNEKRLKTKWVNTYEENDSMKPSHFAQRTPGCNAGKNESFALRSTNTKLQGGTEWVLCTLLDEHPGGMEMARTSLTDFKINFGILESCWHSQLYTISFNNATALHKL